MNCCATAWLCTTRSTPGAARFRAKPTFGRLPATGFRGRRPDIHDHSLQAALARLDHMESRTGTVVLIGSSLREQCGTPRVAEAELVIVHLLWARAVRDFGD